ncbi:MAG: PilT protein domain-containing protein [Parcubacteria group bacterium Gr01-1014_29]|nr:MAG: PilT protein domain-containing protein [Parcubacteria group bacterium Gr01-1014_29]
MEETAAETVLLDSNYIIGILNGDIPVEEFAFRRYAISVVTVMELYALAGMSADEEKRIDEAIRHLDIISIDASIAKQAGILARTRKRGKPDLLIAATALVLHVPLLTHNIRDFKNIPDLKLLKV